MKHPTHSMLAVAGTVLCYMADSPPAFGAAVPASTDTQRLLNAWVDALGGADALGGFRTLYFRSSIETAGLHGTIEEWYSAEGLVRQHFVIPDIMETWTVFDGTEFWQRDLNGKVRRLAGGERENGITGAALNSFAHLLPGRLSVHIESVASAHGPALKLIPSGGSRVTIVLDPKTFLPTRQEQPEADRTRVTTFSDWREVGGIRFPFEMRSTVGDARSDSTVRLEQVQFDPPLAPGTFSKPEEGPPDFRFTKGTSARDIPFQLASNHIFVQTRINGSDPLWLLLDTGAAASVLNTSRANQLGLKSHGKLEGRGAGEGSVDVSILTDVSFELQGVELTDQTIAAIPLDALEPYEGRRLDGVLGYDFLSRFVVEIDYAAKRLHLYDARSYEYTGRGEMIPVVIEDGILFARAKVFTENGAPVEAKFTIDTGARSALGLSKPFIEEHSIQPTDGKLLEALQGIGVGGENKGKLGRLKAIQLGSFRFEDLVAGFSEDTQGALANPENAGILGGEVLRRFTMTVDYGRERMFLEPNGDFSQPYLYDASGLFVIADGPALDGVKVHRVETDSPAAQAGLAKGDLVVRVDDKPVAEIGIDDLRAKLRQAGQRVKLDIKRGEQNLTFDLELRKLL